MKIYKGWKRTKGEQISEHKVLVDIKNSEGIDWYDLMEELDHRSEKWVVGYHKDNYISWFTEGKVSGYYAPLDDMSVIVCDSFIPENEDPRQYIFDGREFIKKEQPVVLKRNKEDILADLERLKTELLSL